MQRRTVILLAAGIPALVLLLFSLACAATGAVLLANSPDPNANLPPARSVGFAEFGNQVQSASLNYTPPPDYRRPAMILFICAGAGLFLSLLCVGGGALAFIVTPGRRTVASAGEPVEGHTVRTRTVVLLVASAFALLVFIACAGIGVLAVSGYRWSQVEERERQRHEKALHDSIEKLNDNAGKAAVPAWQPPKPDPNRAPPPDADNNPFKGKGN